MPPRILYQEFARQAERELGAFVSNNLWQLGKYRSNFTSALALFDFAYSNRRDADDNLSPTHLDWMSIAARDGAMMLYHFGMTIRSFDGMLKNAPCLAKSTDTKLLNEGKEFFEKSFADYYDVRQGVAHLADNSKTPESLQRHGITESSPFVQIIGDASQFPVYFNGMLSDRKLWATVKGKTVWYELSAESLQKLEEAEKIVYQAFANVEKDTWAMLRKREQNGDPLPDG